DDQQGRAVPERRHDRGAAKTVGIARGRTAARQRGGAPRGAERQHVAEIVRSVGNQRERVGGDAEAGLDREIDEIERDADGEGPAERRRRVAMSMMSVIMTVAVIVTVLQRVRHSSAYNTA